MGTDDTRLQDWVGRTESARDRIALDRCHAMQATLDRPGPPLRDGDPLPPLWHWLYFWTAVPRSGLGPDGHPALGGFLPPLGTARRMWAGSRIEFLRPLRIGEQAERVSTIASIEAKQGRSGRLVFVTVRHEISGPDGLAIVDEHDIVYREVEGGNAAPPPAEPAPIDAAYREEFNADPTLLFRYSALTFNGHRIHYDRDYATGVEGYPGLIVHGPLLATLLVDLAARSCPHHRIEQFEFRARRPVIDTGSFILCGARLDGGAMDLWIADGEGKLAMTATANLVAAA